MTQEAPKQRGWREVAQEQRYNLRLLGTHVGRSHYTMRAYAMGRRPVPQAVLDKLSELFGERVA